MLPVFSSRYQRRTAKGSALIIVLFFIVLMTIVTVAFLSRSLTAVKVAAGSSGETKSKLLAASASDIIIGDFKQEIIAGSSLASGSTVNYPIYAPTVNATAIPFMNGVPMAGTPSTNAIPNLICRSVSPANTSGSAPYVSYSASYTASLIPPARAASDSSAATTSYSTSKVNSVTPSINGRYVSASQWNSHYLIPRDPSVNTPGSTSADSTPVPAFVPPDWVIVTRGGVASVSTTTPGMSAGGLTDPTPSNVNYAVGRYAYAVYNEGGLLDMNAAGYPADPALSTNAAPPFYTGTPAGLTPTQISQKVGVALSDLTQLPAGSTSMTQSQVNNIVGWRNYASASLTSANGSFNTFSFTPTTATSWLNNFVLGNTNGFMQVVPPPAGVTTPPTDQAFLSRLQLIGVTQSLGISPDFLQYMGTFSRAMEQPSVIPDTGRPKILNNGLTPPVMGGSPNEDTYIGNNDGQGGDTDPSGINPSFPSLRVTNVTTAFTRWNGTTAVLGEPYVKTKFALNWLKMVAYNATNSSLPAGFAATTGDPNPILDRFGLTRSSTSSPWVYNHGQTSIKKLSSITGREPDFAELLKAAIIAGSLGKAGPNLNVGNNNYQYTVDSSIDLQVIQIMANLIDQQDADSYPTVIQINGRTIYGVEDLPYFYRYHLLSVIDKAPSTILSNSTSASFSDPTGTTTTGSITTALDYTNPAATGQSASWKFDGTSVPTTAPATINGIAKGTVTSAGAGEATFLYIPELWNPHDQNCILGENTSLRPTNFRIYAVTDDPLSTPPTAQWSVGAEAQLSGSNNYAGDPLAIPPKPPTTSMSKIIPETGSGDISPQPNYYHWPISLPKAYSPPTAYNTTGDNIMYFSDGGTTSTTMGTLFREPTLLWNTNPTGIGLSSTTSPNVKDVNTNNVFYGIISGRSPCQLQVNFTSTPANSAIDGSWIVQGNALNDLTYTPAGTYAQISFFLQYQDPNNSQNWITYDVKYPDLHGLSSPNLVINTTTDYPNYTNLLQTSQFPAHATSFDPRTARWGVGTASALGHVPSAAYGGYAASGITTTSYLLEPTANGNYNKSTLGLFSVMETDRPRGDKGNEVLYSNPCMTSNPGKNVQMHWFGGVGYSGSNGSATSPLQFNGLFSQNNPAITFMSKGTQTIPPTSTQLFVEDPDGMVRLAMGAYASTSDTDTSNLSTAQTPTASRIGLPEATADTVTDKAVGTPTAQSQSRPVIINRPFRSVSEMSYAFTGTPWKNIDFFTPASGDSALLDTFCINEPPASAMVAGKVDLNTRQIPVLQAMVAGAYRDEMNNVSSPPTYALPSINGGEAKVVATTLEQITSDTSHAWRGPLKNVSDLVGHYVATPTSTTDTDFYTYTPSSPNAAQGQLSSMSYAGLTAALDCTSFFGTANHAYTNTVNGASASAPFIQRFREAAIRPLAAAGQVRVWNLLIDVVAQTGHYPKTATSLDQFFVDGQTRLWVHVAIDRYTGQVIDKQVEVVTP